MKKKILGGFLALMLLIALLLNFTNKNYYYKTLWYNLPGIFDEDIFYSREIHKSTEVQLWNNSAAYNHTQLSEELSDTLIKYQTTAVLFIQHDSIFIEHY